MLNYKKDKNCLMTDKKGHTGDIYFWIFATIFLFLFFTVFVIVSISMSTLKDIKLLLTSVSGDTGGLKEESQIFTEKTILAGELNSANKEQIATLLKQK
jgi:hypothetical protein